MLPVFKRLYRSNSPRRRQSESTPTCRARGTARNGRTRELRVSSPRPWPRLRRMNPLSHPLVIVNPSAGRGRAAALRHAIESYWRGQRVSAEFVTPGSREEVRIRARGAANAGYSSVIVLGGDGTVHEVINGLAG